MKISYNWLKEYINHLPDPQETARILTDTGLEVEGIEVFESVKGGLKGVVIGKVVECRKHPNADKLSITRVDTGTGDLIPIVCGAPNVKAGQKVAVANVGTTLYMGNESLTLKKVKIRGEESQGMICAEDELGLGTEHDGIMVLDPDAEIGMKASDYFNIESDIVFEIGLTPNRIDGASHIGVARDIVAFLRQTDKEVHLQKPPVDKFTIDNNKKTFHISVEDPEACPRYSGITISGLEVKPSPEWLQNRLRAIGLNPINNLVDITNYVLHETGQPLHAFDASKVEGEKIIIKTLPEGSTFVTLDEEKRQLSSKDLMICNENSAMCIAGVFGGIESGVTEKTTSIFLESACFNPVYIRKTAKRHGLNTDSSFRFERGSDPNMTIYALKRAAMLMKELADGQISSELIDIYPVPVKNFNITLELSYLRRLTGKLIETNKIKSILQDLDIETLKDTGQALDLSVPPYRVDVQRPADVVEEILRIYGYNNIETSGALRSSLSYIKKPDNEKLTHIVGEMLSSNGFNEIMSNSLTKSAYYEEEENANKNLVRIVNPLSADLNAMRKNLLYGGLEAISYNVNRKNPDLKIFEFGNIYLKNNGGENDDPLSKYHEEEHLALFLTGKKYPESWIAESGKTDFYELKSYVEKILKRTGLNIQKSIKIENNDFFSEGLSLTVKGNQCIILGKVAHEILELFDLETDVYYADLNWTRIVSSVSLKTTTFKPLPRFPEVRRDLSMILEKSATFADISKIAYQSERSRLINLNIFDVYEGDKIEKGKKSYAVSFILQDQQATLTDKQIDKIMQKIAGNLEKELGAKIRS